MTFKQNFRQVSVKVETCDIVKALSDGALAVVLWIKIICHRLPFSNWSWRFWLENPSVGLKAMMSVIMMLVERWLKILHLRAGGSWAGRAPGWRPGCPGRRWWARSGLGWGRSGGRRWSPWLCASSDGCGRGKQIARRWEQREWGQRIG